MLERIKNREEYRHKLAKRIGEKEQFDDFVNLKLLLMLTEILDDYLKHRITADKTIEGILKDIQADTSRIAEK